MVPFSCGYLSDSFPADFQDFVDLCKSNQKVLLPTVACTFQLPLMVHILKTLYSVGFFRWGVKEAIGSSLEGLIHIHQIMTRSWCFLLQVKFASSVGIGNVLNCPTASMWHQHGDLT